MNATLDQADLDRGTLTREEFERWLALQQTLGWRVRNPEVIEQIRDEYRKGATLAPFRQVKP
jgi:hypothetical protein